jgi:GNAT superfamily N-acetyltransferase
VVVGAARREDLPALLALRALEIARSAGCYRIQLLSAADQPAPALYESNGFRAIARGSRRYL